MSLAFVLTFEQAMAALVSYRRAHEPAFPTAPASCVGQLQPESRGGSLRADALLSATR